MTFHLTAVCSECGDDEVVEIDEYETASIDAFSDGWKEDDCGDLICPQCNEEYQEELFPKVLEGHPNPARALEAGRSYRSSWSTEYNPTGVKAYTKEICPACGTIHGGE